MQTQSTDFFCTATVAVLALFAGFIALMMLVCGVLTSLGLGHSVELMGMPVPDNSIFQVAVLFAFLGYSLQQTALNSARFCRALD